MLLPLAEDPAQLLCESGTVCALAEQSQFIFMPLQQCTQNHCAAFIVQQFWRRDIKFFKNKLREPLKGKNVQPHVTVEGTMGEQLAFELESGLFGREKDKRRATGIVFEQGADFSEAAESFAAAGGAEKNSGLHDLFSRKSTTSQRNLFQPRPIKCI
jgi:hypothetical protein